jgi:hypothetical protein
MADPLRDVRGGCDLRSHPPPVATCASLSKADTKVSAFDSDAAACGGQNVLCGGGRAPPPARSARPWSSARGRRPPTTAGRGPFRAPPPPPAVAPWRSTMVERCGPAGAAAPPSI